MDSSFPSSFPAVDRVYRATKDAILSGEFAAGQWLSEAEIAKQLGASRTPAREAFVRLEREGFLQLVPRRGALVTVISPNEALDVLEVRHALEVSAVQRLSRQRDRAGRLRAARELTEAQTEAVQAGRLEWFKELDGFVGSDESFHNAIVIASGNDLAARMYQMLRDRQIRMLRAANIEASGTAVLVEEHCTLVQAAIDGDVETFQQAHWKHLVSTHAALIGSHEWLPAAPSGLA